MNDKRLNKSYGINSSKNPEENLSIKGAQENRRKTNGLGSHRTWSLRALASLRRRCLAQGIRGSGSLAAAIGEENKTTRACDLRNGWGNGVSYERMGTNFCAAAHALIPEQAGVIRDG